MKWPGLRPPRVWHPLLIGVIPILSAYVGNLHAVAVQELLLPLALTLGLVIVFWVLVSWRFKDVAKAALVVSATAMFLLNFGDLDDALGSPPAGTSKLLLFLKPLGVLLVGGLLLAVVLREVLKRPKAIGPLTRLLNSFTVLVVGALLFLALKPHLFGAAAQTKPGNEKGNRSGSAASVPPNLVRPGEGNGEGAGAVVETAAHPARLPDIYYIILDAYGRNDRLKEIYQYDNQPFLDKLRQLGFYVAEQSTSNYCQTPLSLSCSLNLDYHNDLAGSDRDTWILHTRVHDSSLFKTLKKHGYRIIAYRSGLFTTDLSDADEYLSPSLASADAPSDFNALLEEKTVLRLYQRTRYFLSDETVEGTDAYAYNRKLIRYVFDTLGKTAREPAPKFVFAHVICPHPPFLFGPNGEDISPRPLPYESTDGSFYITKYHDPDYVGGYRKQLQFVNKMAERAIGDILKNSPEPPVIILQSDHGPGSRWNCDSSDPNKSDVKERMSILNAYYVPNGGDRGLYDSISPVNSFRVLLNNYFGAHLDLRPDESFFSSIKEPFHFVDVTDRVRPPASPPRK